MSNINSVTGRADINEVLAQMRNVKAQIQKTSLSEPSPGQLGSIDQTQQVPKFSDMLVKAVDTVNQTQLKASELATAFE
ncbi:MAG: flagellar hook-basal body complex protein FliE, partial [Phototrophicales bacterium]